MARQFFLLFSTLFLFYSCAKEDTLSDICKDATAESYDPNFMVWCPTQESDYFIPVRYGCPPNGDGVSPPIRWKGVPKEATHLKLIVEDATCTYECNGCCKYRHWVLHFPLKDLKEGFAISPHEIEEGASKDSSLLKYTLNNTSHKKEYMPFCPPKIQTHAYVFKLIAFRIEGNTPKIVGRAQSMPLLFSLEHK